MKSKTYMSANFNRYFTSPLILAAVLLTGCQTGSESSQSESPDVLPSQSDTIVSDSGESSELSPSQSDTTDSSESSELSPSQSDTTDSDSGESSDTSSAEDDDLSGDFSFSAGREYPDDKIAPDEWIPVDSRLEGIKKRESF